jgi:ribosome-associated protein
MAKRKGFYVKGRLVTEAPEPEPGPPSRTARKKASEELQALGEQLVTARPARLVGLVLPEALDDAVQEAKAIRSFGARRRQLQYIGKLMRSLDDETVESIRRAMTKP